MAAAFAVCFLLFGGATCLSIAAQFESDRSLENVGHLARMSVELRELVERFRVP
jgi:hypothetical protein